MTEYEKLLDEVHQLGIKILEVDVSTNKEYGLYLGNIIIINSNMTDTQKYCVLAEELCHHITTYGDITDLTKSENRKEEFKARKVACEKLITPECIIKALLSGANNMHELAEELTVTKSFLLDTINHYKKKYGIYYVGKTHLLTFEPLNIVNF
ncbi:ImmA/IrrE family metallo-endopeptidase [Clostridium tertium]|uniref:ImmA/IrrE family metallo-endopeptidase n=1 Tax=Clostridium tertium TaxID=1559 RepID=UPI00232DE757|nr:ImmA/IrrE family metallo-endopeptidase [Clostridium tertium]MDB1935097.1 ImmA/IrrE family metallo-endopeptidase [Clostridium tertium]MDB1938448.1 ImmA/IrrE family metallo-endopeptidase [Clostridium tertium]